MVLWARALHPAPLPPTDGYAAPYHHDTHTPIHAGEASTLTCAASGDTVACFARYGMERCVDQFSTLRDLLELEKRNDPHLLSEEQVNCHGQLVRLFWSAGAARTLRRAYHHVLTMDSTFKTNRYVVWISRG